MKLKKGDYIFIYYKNDRSSNWYKAIVEYFQLGHMAYKCTGFESSTYFIPYRPYRFYGSGYRESERYVVIKKRWHYPFAVIAEWIRLNFTNK